MLFFRVLLFSALMGVGSLISAQQVPAYTVRLGEFQNPRMETFEVVKPLGFVYAVPGRNGQAEVFLGGWSEESKARSAAREARAMGYGSASVRRLPVEQGRTVIVVQLALRDARKPIDWEAFRSFEKLFVLLNDQEVKIFTGPFPDMAAARALLPQIRSRGFSDAFPRSVNEVLLHPLGRFELGGEAQPLIPLEFENAGRPTNPTPKGYEATDPVLNAPATPSSTFTRQSELPNIRSRVKRTSARLLQEVLKAQGTYKGSLDGYYGKGTREGFARAWNANRQIEKYRDLAVRNTATADPLSAELQNAINNLWQDPTRSYAALAAFDTPLSKAYRAYYLLVSQGLSAQAQVNRLMNEAMDQAFRGKKPSDFPGFDFRSNHTYNDVSQLLLHLRYIHQAEGGEFQVPCWLFERHPVAAKVAFEGHSAQLNLQPCGGFLNWEPLVVLKAIADDISADKKLAGTLEAERLALLQKMSTDPTPLSDKERLRLRQWEDKLLKGLDGWSMRESFLREIATAFKLAFLQSQVLLEDHFMDLGFQYREAEGMALAVLEALVGKQVERFV